MLNFVTYDMIKEMYLSIKNWIFNENSSVENNVCWNAKKLDSS